MKQLADDIRAKENDLHAPGGYPEQSDPETGMRMAEGGRLSVVFVRPAANSLDLAGNLQHFDQLGYIVIATTLVSLVLMYFLQKNVPEEFRR